MPAWQLRSRLRFMSSLYRYIERRDFLLPFIALLALYCGWVLTLPLFPSLDGPLHLYYASVLGSLLAGSKTYSSYYFIRHLVPPYAVHYYLLIALAHFFGFLLAEKLMVCLIFITTAFGFRYLTHQLGPGGELASLFCIPLLLNWSLGMGFYSYCLAIGIALWTMAIWYQASAKRSHMLWIVFLFAVIVTVLTHPVPALFVYLLVAVDILWCVRHNLFDSTHPRNSGFSPIIAIRWDIFYMVAAWSTSIYIVHFTAKRRVLANVLHTYNRKLVLLRLIKLSTLAIFSGSQVTTLLYRASLYLILIFSIAIAMRGFRTRWRQHGTTRTDVLLLCSLFLAVLIPFLPPVMNGANYFSQRLTVLVWIGALAAASGNLAIQGKQRLATAGIALVYGASVIALANQRIRPVAMQINPIETMPVFPQHSTGLALALPNGPEPADLNYVPYYWAAARFYRRTHSVLLNGGWLYESYLPLGSHVDMITNQLTPELLDSPGDTYHLLLTSKYAQSQIMPHVNLVVFVGYADAGSLVAALKIMDEAEPSREWNCQSEKWYSVCTSAFSKTQIMH